MIRVTRLDGSPMLLNDDQILFIEGAHDTIVSLANGDKLRVLEDPDEIVERIAHWRRRAAGFALPGLEAADDGE